ncbi:MAG: hypothetical protein JXB85_06310 [Anaerolineales bacterium]|nr:hypothetical protein [Anaerolineales bacterium]
MKQTLILLVLPFLLIGCGPSPEQQATLTATARTATAAMWTETFTPTNTATATPTLTPTFTRTPTLTDTPTITPTFTITPTATYDFPDVVVSVAMAHCRYGPSTAYLHAADLYQGDLGTVRGRSPYNGWLQVRFDKLSYFCWVAPSVVQVTSGDVSLIYVVRGPGVNMPGPSALYGPPTNVRASRQGDQVTITWDPVWMTEDDDRGYFIEMFVCQDGAYIWWTVGEGTLNNQYVTSYTVRDEPGCAYPSYGQIYTVEKHGYTTPATIPWPAANP